MPLPSHSDGSQDGLDRRQRDRFARANQAAMDDGAFIATEQPWHALPGGRIDDVYIAEAANDGQSTGERNRWCLLRSIAT
jgi:hypothetical protein